MKRQIDRIKQVTLTLRGFKHSAQEVADLIGVASSRQGDAGEPVRPYVKTLLTRSYVQYFVQYPDDVSLSDMLSPLILKLGGLKNICDVRDKIKAEFLELHFDLPVISSDFPQEGYFSNSDIALCFQLNATISLGFF